MPDPDHSSELITRSENQTLDPDMDSASATGLNLHSKPQGSGVSHVSEPSKTIETRSVTGSLCISGRNANLIDVDVLSKILAFVDKVNRGLSSKEKETISFLERQYFNNPMASPDGIFTYLHLWKKHGKADANDYVRRWNLLPAIEEWIAKTGQIAH